APGPFSSFGNILSVAALSTSKSFFLVKYINARLNVSAPLLESLSSVGCFVPSKLVPKSELSIPPPMAPPATYPVVLRNLRRDKSVSSLSLVLFSSSDNVIPPHHSVVYYPFYPSICCINVIRYFYFTTC